MKSSPILEDSPYFVMSCKHLFYRFKGHIVVRLKKLAEDYNYILIDIAPVLFSKFVKMLLNTYEIVKLFSTYIDSSCIYSKHSMRHIISSSTCKVL